ncbi:adenylate/guanylate cyclase domain-containing protein [Archangium primigenium]|uniref:adenylate/guanylate cyclase domain-containing protein n=1 Tax=[Archangium] primigenium TaxID=2792470 RepID=UPI001956F273|nr:adenylate/guanylate cyclase domain-containing protein [Archangium primigenium]MBM7118187.1 HAMP domain-containing protein [Archangium primigenium]
MDAAPPPPVTPAAPRGVSLFTRLFLLVLLCALPPLVGLGWKMMDTNVAALQELVRHLHRSIVGDVQRSVRGALVRVEQDLEGLGQILFAPGLGEDTTRYALVGTRVAALETIDFLTLYAPNGQSVTTVKADEVPAPQVPARLDARLVASLEASRGHLVVQDVRAGAEGGPVLEVFYPLVREGRVRAILGTQVKLGPLCALMGTLGERFLGARDNVFVVDRQRRLVLHADPARVAAREDFSRHGLFQALSGDSSFSTDMVAISDFHQGDQEMMGSLEALSELGWAVAVQQPQAVAYASLSEMRQSILAALVLAALVALGAGLVGARQLTRPLRDLVLATRALAERTFQGVAARVTRRSDELGTLGRAFEGMARTLESKEREVVAQAEARAALSRYLSPEVVELVVSNPGQLRLGGERREVTIVFADVVGFTRLAESQPPEVIVALLNELFTFATEIIQRRGGIIDKFIGDCIMAVWGTPQSHADDALRAVQAAEDLRRWLDVGNRRWRERWGIEIQLAIGVHTGPAVAGNVGSDKRMEYTVIGDTVNVAARLESMAQPGQILVSEATHERLGADASELVPAGERQLSGRTAVTRTYEVPA